MVKVIVPVIIILLLLAGLVFIVAWGRNQVLRMINNGSLRWIHLPAILFVLVAAIALIAKVVETLPG